MDDEWAGSTIKRGNSEDTHEVRLAAAPLQPMGFEERYLRDRVLGEGGMGTVISYQDRQIGRRIAMKVLRADQAADAGAAGRFVREAMIQGQLEHPSVVPVYDLGADTNRGTWFTMKRVRGITLRAVIDGLHAGDPALTAAWSRRRLLAAFSSVCLAIHFAHERGVLHRDLKPENLMLGDYGEVYVLDWGLAAVRDSTDTAGAPVETRAAGETLEGTVMGTPGYMSPEQVRGQPASFASDLYSLGAILFELVTLRPLHEGRNVDRLLAATVHGADARGSVRAPEREVPFELEQIMVRATALDPARRYPSARALQDDVERYLDGERDLQRSVEQAQHHAKTALQLAGRARVENDPGFAYRRQAMREIGRALALDPGNRDATQAMMKLLTEPPARLPPEVVDEEQRSLRQQVRHLALIGGLAYLSMILYLPFFIWSGVRDWRWVAAFYGFSLAASVTSFATRASRNPTDNKVLVVMALSNLAMVATAAFFGAFFVTPALIAVNTVAFAIHLRTTKRTMTMIIGCITMLATAALQLGGFLPVSYQFSSAQLTIAAGAVDLSRAPTLALLMVTSLGTVLTAALPITQVREGMAEMERRLYLYTWHLREMIPEAVRGQSESSRESGAWGIVRGPQ
jgi:eukaryotic-like serine/threonine-protein kinase